MGAWGTGNFDNDSAADLLDDLVAQHTLKPIEDAFDAILSLNGYIDVDYGAEAISAAEVVAFLKGRPPQYMPDILIEWHQSHQLTVDAALIAKAILAVEKATTDPKISELRELWEPEHASFVEHFTEWYAIITDLLVRLRS